MSRRRFLALLGSGLLAAGTGASVLSVYRFHIEFIEAPLAGLRDPLHVAFLSDLHYGPFIGSGSVAAWVDATLELEPDLIVLGGDLVDNRLRRTPAALVGELARLRAPLGVYTVWGNHDHTRFGHGIGDFAADLAAIGVKLLRNSGELVRDDLSLMGIDDLREGSPDLAAALATRKANAASLLVSHNPDVLPMVPLDVGLTLAGHTHGGQVRLPLIGPLATSSHYGRRFVAGWVNGPARGYVSRGLGVAQLPLRIDCPPELTSLRLVPRAKL